MFIMLAHCKGLNRAIYGKSVYKITAVNKLWQARDVIDMRVVITNSLVSFFFHKNIFFVVYIFYSLHKHSVNGLIEKQYKRKTDV